MKIIKLLIIMISLLLTGCKSNETFKEKNKSDNSQSKVEKEDEMMVKTIFIYVNNHKFECDLEDNSSANALVEKLKDEDINIEMSDYGDFEKVGRLPFSLPTNDEKITTKPGDVILYLGNNLTIYYDQNSFTFTKIGHIKGQNRDSMLSVLGKDDVSVRISLS